MTKQHRDASYLKDYQRCPEYARLRHHHGWSAPRSSPTALDAGIAIHSGLAAYYRSGSTELSLEAVRLAWHQWSVREKLEGTAFDITLPQLESVIKSYIKYWTASRKRDDWEVLDVERYLEAEIAPGVPWCGILDLRVRTSSGVYTVDHKTTGNYFSANWWDIHHASIQQVGYGALCRALGMQWDGFMINGIKIPNKKSNKIAFAEGQVQKTPQWRIDDVARTIERDLATVPDDIDTEWARREQGCYSWWRPCQFKPVCYAHPEIRPAKLAENYIVDHWIPKEKGTQ